MAAQIFIHNPRTDKIHRRNNAGKPHSDEYAAGNGAVQVFRKIQRNKGQSQPNKRGTPHGHKGKLFNQNGPDGDAAHRQKQYDAEQDGVRRSRQTQRIVHVKRNRRHNEGQSRAVKRVRKAEQPKAQVGEHIAQGCKELWFYRIIIERRLFASDRHVQNNRAGKQSVDNSRFAVADFFRNNRRERNADNHCHQLKGLAQRIRFCALGIGPEQFGEQRRIVCVDKRIERSGQHVRQQHIEEKTVRPDKRGYVKKRDKRKNQQGRSDHKPQAPSSPAAVRFIG